MTITLTGIDAAKKFISLDEAAQKKIMSKAANKVRSIVGKRITQQTDLDGKRFTPRSENTSEKLRRKKMLTGLRRLLRVVTLNNDEAEIGFRGKSYIIAKEQQQGILRSEAFKITDGWTDNRGTFRAKRKNHHLSKMFASARQAEVLMSIGYSKPNGDAASIQWIRKNLSENQAGFLIRTIRLGMNHERHTRFYLPPRSFLGLTKSDEKEVMDLFESLITEHYRHITSGY